MIPLPHKRDCGFDDIAHFDHCHSVHSTHQLNLSSNQSLPCCNQESYCLSVVCLFRLVTRATVMQRHYTLICVSCLLLSTFPTLLLVYTSKSHKISSEAESYHLFKINIQHRLQHRCRGLDILLPESRTNIYYHHYRPFVRPHLFSQHERSPLAGHAGHGASRWLRACSAARACAQARVGEAVYLGGFGITVGRVRVLIRAKHQI